ncbi:helix-turn-helix domain-containing protein [Ileibacterium valens]|uniref:HTH cro/C1-type domain-containing protein n=1 Tax=Ileibacterium valens TaxID=1862668 RepID=A0A1U7NCI1_9FIRM|nr:helix-turn-helix transcriptional regulator [Ileibacterium valens]OLU36159.1 hypothetical protein BO222_12960 [Ileibacterium valens]OLU38731.1 hypothetical protein BO224_08525 [Erysipelotrichaceae bacterium NYU-BL-E8]OLU38923.1 hypothetical protein BM735_08515 [Erysipelotrichaceae bacterium NYU-BL-F16]
MNERSSNKNSQPSKKVDTCLSIEQEIVKAIREQRNRLAITQNELSRRTGIDQGDISKLEHGTRNPSLKLLKRLAEGLELDLIVRFVPKEEKGNGDSQQEDEKS